MSTLLLAASLALGAEAPPETLPEPRLSDPSAVAFGSVAGASAFGVVGGAGGLYVGTLVFTGNDDAMLQFAVGMVGSGLGWFAGSYLGARWTYWQRGLDLEPFHSRTRQVLAYGGIGLLLGMGIVFVMPAAVALLLFGIPVVAVIAAQPKHQQPVELSVAPLLSSQAEASYGGLLLSGSF